MSKVVSFQKLTVPSVSRSGVLLGLMLVGGMACGRDEPESSPPLQSEEADPPPPLQSEEADPPRPTLINGSFETGPIRKEEGQFTTLFPGNGELSGWTISGGGVDYIFHMWRSADGVRSLDLSALSEGAISQPIDNLKPGVTYTVHFWLAGNGDCAPVTKQLRVEAADQTMDFTFDTTRRTAADMGWTRHRFVFTARAPSTLLTFRSRTGGHCGPALDGIELSIP